MILFKIQYLQNKLKYEFLNIGPQSLIKYTYFDLVKKQTLNDNATNNTNDSTYFVL